MRLVLNGKINSLYVQSLCMMFFRGEKFPVNEENPKGELCVSLSDDDGNFNCEAKLVYLGKTSFGNACASVMCGETQDRAAKIAVGKAVLSACIDYTGYTPPWGLLTGIRPSVVAQELILEGGNEFAERILIDRYLLAPEKAKLAAVFFLKGGETE